MGLSKHMPLVIILTRAVQHIFSIPSLRDFQKHYLDAERTLVCFIIVLNQSQKNAMLYLAYLDIVQ